MSTAKRNPSRRTLLRGVAASAVVAPVALAANPRQDAELLALCFQEAACTAEFHRLNNAEEAGGQPEIRAEIDRLVPELRQLRDRILPIPAATADGMRAKARLLRETVTLCFDETGPCDGSDFQDRLVWSLTADLLRGA
jgi:hypothetical protein